MQRIHIYPALGLAEDRDLVAAMAAATGLDVERIAARLGTGGPVELDDLEDGAARSLFALLEERGIDADLEPMGLESGLAGWLAAEAPKWVKRGLLHPAAVPLIFGNYGLEPPATPAGPARATAKTGEPDPSTLLRAVLTIGAVLIGLGLILFIAANWQKIPAPAKIGGALALTVVALHLGYRARFRERSRPRLGAALFLISLFGIGGVVILIGQVYHVQADSYLLPLVWGFLCVPMALLLRFSPALYAASGLWFWSYWLYAQEHQALPWIYPVLLIGFLLPYSVLTGDKWLHRTHLAVLMIAILTTLAASDFWHCSVFVAALVLLRWRIREPLYDWLLVAGFFLWSVSYLDAFDDLPNVFYALPLAYFFYRARSTGSNGLMIANVLNAQYWVLVMLYQLTERFSLRAPETTGVLMFLLVSGLVWFGFGKRLERTDRWKGLSSFLRYGGVMLAGAMVYVLSFRFYDQKTSFYDSRLFLGATLALAAVALALALPPVVAQAGRGGRRGGEPLLLGLTAVSIAISVLVPASRVIHSLLFNIILFTGALIMMARGHRSQSLAWYNGGIAIFVVLIASRYLDTFEEYLPRSIFFMVGGVFLIAWAIFVERKRRKNA